MRIVVRFQSISDIITNSSSEVFVVKKGASSVEEVKDFIETAAKSYAEAYDKDWQNSYKKSWKQLEEEGLDGNSGMGGELSIYSFEEMYESYAKYHPNPTIEDFADYHGLPVEGLDKYVWIDVDWSRRATIKFIHDYFEVVENDIC